MMVFIGAGLLIGGLLGARLTVLALIPASGLAMVVPALAWAANPGGAGWTVLDVVGLIVFLQVGYLCGAGSRFLAGAIPMPPKSNTTPQRLPVNSDGPPAGR